jgi:hypothetical protein
MIRTPRRREQAQGLLVAVAILVMMTLLGGSPMTRQSKGLGSGSQGIRAGVAPLLSSSRIPDTAAFHRRNFEKTISTRTVPQFRDPNRMVAPLLQKVDVLAGR